jgi:hypothetical protein
MAQRKATKERRDHPRVEKLNLVQISRFDEEGFRADLATGRTLDISPGGVRLELYHPLPLRSVLTLTLALNDQLIEVTGTVVHLEVVDADRCAMGVEFTDLSHDARRVIDAHVAAGGAS